MKIINDGLPDLIYKFLCQDFYDFKPTSTSISATGLLRPTREIILTRRHHDEIEIKASGRIWSVFGSAVHAVLEKLEGDDIEKEQRLNFNFKNILVSGKFDIIKNNQLNDYKTTSAWTLVYKGRVEEWQKQMSIYRWLYYKVKGKELSDKAHIIVILKDWSASNLRRIRNYPKQPIVELTLELSQLPLIEEFISEKIDELNIMEGVTDDELIPCTDEDRWYNAKTHKYNKCKDYCPAYKFCSQAGKE